MNGVVREVARVGDIAPGAMLHVEVDGKSLALYHSEGAFYATDDICTHRRARLSNGYLTGRVVQCPLHFGKFDIVTGEPLNPPCKIPVATYPVTVQGDAIFIELTNE